MSLITAIYRAKPTYSPIGERDIFTYIVYDGQAFCGQADCHPEDMDFFSEKVGKTIALSRARQEALEYAVDVQRDIANTKY